MGDFVVVVGSWRTLCVLLTFCVGCTVFAEIRYAHNELILAHSSLLLYFCGWQQTCSRCANIFVEAEQSWAQMTLQASCLSSCQAWHEHHSIHTTTAAIFIATITIMCYETTWTFLCNALMMIWMMPLADERTWPITFSLHIDFGSNCFQLLSTKITDLCTNLVKIHWC